MARSVTSVWAALSAWLMLGACLGLVTGWWVGSSTSSSPAPPTSIAIPGVGASKPAPSPAEPPFDAVRFDWVDPSLEPLKGPTTVGALIQARGCSTEKTRSLNAQIAAEINCARPGAFEFIGDIPNVRLEPGANPVLQRPAAEALAAVARDRHWRPLSVNSTWRSPAQQHILKSWEGSCGVSLAAPVGRSRHESGLAIDLPLSVIYEFHPELRAGGWRWFCDANRQGDIRGCRDVPHFTISGGRDMRALGVRAFQRLWNRAHPDDRLPVSGHFTSATASRMNRAPLAGFVTGTTCGGGRGWGVSVARFVDVPEGHRHHDEVEVGAAADWWRACAEASASFEARFCPSDGVSRAELAVVLSRALRLPRAATSPAFEDIPEGAHYADAVASLVAAGVTEGCRLIGEEGEGEGVGQGSPTRFCPSAPVTWAQAAAWLSRARHVSVSRGAGRFDDVAASNWAAPHVEAMAAAGLMPGCRPSRGRFCAQWRLSRARMAEFVTRALSSGGR